MSNDILLRATENNTSFSREIPGLQFAWDSTSLGLLKTCPWKYYLSIILGWNPKSMAAPLQFGIWFHEAMERYFTLRAKEVSHEEALHETAKFLLLKSGERDSEGRFIPWESDDNRRNRSTLLRAVVWYLDQHKNDVLKTYIRSNGSAAVELSFRFGFGETAPSGEEYLLAGHIDRVVEFNDDLYVTDYKTTGSTLSSHFFSQFTPNNQMSLYTVAGQIILDKPIAGVIIDGIQVAVNFNRYARGFAPRNKDTIDEWLEDTHQWIKVAEQYASAGSWPMNDTACNMYGGCAFKEICDKSPKVREQFLESNFIRRVWDPLVSRGE